VAHLYSLIFFLVVGASVFVHRPSVASEIVVELLVPPGGIGKPSEWIARLTGNYGNTSCSNSPGAIVCANSWFGSVSYPYFPKYALPSNSTYDGSGGFSCNSDFTESSGSCVPRATPAAACAEVSSWTNKGMQMAAAGKSLTKIVCFKGQTVNARDAILGYLGNNYIFGPYVCPGTPCTEGPGVATAQVVSNPSQVVSSIDCSRAGGQFGKVNGVDVCIPPAPLAGNTPGISDAGVKTSTRPDGSVVSTQASTACDGSNCTTSTATTTTPPGGTATTATQTDVKPQAAFCSENPSLPMCRDSKYAVTACSAPPSCDGDPIQCAIARQSWATACALDSTDTAESTAGRSAAAVTGDQSESLPGNRTISVGSSSFDQTPIFTSTGMSDLSVTVSHSTFSLPLSQVNFVLEMLGNIGVAVSFLASMRITFGGSIA